MVPLLFLTVLGLLIGGLGAPAYAAAGTISGTVTRQGSIGNDPIGGVLVSLLDANGNPVSVNGTPVTARTSEDEATRGTYTLSTPDSTVAYKLSFSGNLIRTEFYNNAATPAAATSLTGTRTGIDAAVASTERSEIGGRLTTTGGAPIEGAELRLYQRSPANAQTGEVTYTPELGEGEKFVTDADGRWGPLDLAFGSYLLEVRAPAFGTFYLSSNGTRSTDPKTAPLITVTEGQAQTINASLPAAQTTTISGRVTTGDPATPVRDVLVSVEYPTTSNTGQTTWTEVQATRARTDANGNYTAQVPPLDPAGERAYVVGFSAPGFVTQYFDGKSTRATANTLKPTFADPETLVDASLVAATQVTGRITDASGVAIQGATVSAIRYTPAATQSALGTWSELPNSAESEADGSYTLTVPGDGEPFRLKVVGNTGREVRYFPSATDPNAAQNLTVVQNQVLTGRNVTLPTLAQLGGSVVNADGTAYTGGGEVELYRRVDYTELGEQGGPAHSRWVQATNGRGQLLEANLSNIGAFSLTLPSGSYRLRFDAGANEGFLPGLVGLDTAPSISLSPQQNLSLQTYSLPERNQVRGTVRNLSGTVTALQPVDAFYRYVTDIVDGAPRVSDWIPAGRGVTGSDGGYSIDVFDRTYRVGVEDTGYFTNRTSPTDDIEQADDVTVDGGDRAGIDFRLLTGAPINIAPPFVTGIAAEGETLRAEPGTWSSQDVTFNYVWEYSSTGNAGTWDSVDNDPTNSSTLTNNGRELEIGTRCGLIPIMCNAEYTGYKYRVVVTGTRAGAAGGSSEATSKPTSTAVSPAFPGLPATTTTENRQDPQVTGRALVGETLTGTDGIWSEGGTFTYRWLADGAAIPGATSKTLVLTGAQLGKELVLEVTETSSNPDVIARSQPTPEVGRGVLQATALPAISGEPAAGKTLTATPGTWNEQNLTFAYQWLANGQPIPGATTNRLVLTDAQVGTSIQVRVTATQGDAYSPGTATSESTAPVAEDPTKVTNRSLPVVSGTAKVGEVLTTTNGTWTNEPTSFTYQWLADGVAVTGAVQQTFQPTAAQVGKRMSVRVTAAKTGLASGTATSAQGAPVQPLEVDTCEITVTGGPTVTGTAQVGRLLTVEPGTTDPEGAIAAYQWLRDAQAIAGATAAAYRVVSADEGAALAVRVTYTADGCDDLVRTVQAGTVPEVEEPVEAVKPEIDTTKKVKGKRFVLKVTVTASTQDPVVGDLVLTEGRKVLAEKPLNGKGKRKLVVRGLKRGFHSVRLTFDGNDLVKSRSKTFNFTIR